MKENNPNTNKELMEIYYKAIGEAYIENLIGTLEANKETYRTIEVPESLDKWFHEYNKNLEKSIKKKAFTQRMRRRSFRVALIVAALITVLSVITFSVESIRTRVFNMFIENKEKYTEIQVIDEISADNSIYVPQINRESYCYPEYLPKGYTYSHLDDLSSMLYLYYVNDNKTIIFAQSDSNSSNQIDTEGAEVAEVDINGVKGLLIQKEDRVMIAWVDFDRILNLKGYASKEEMLKIARSLKKNN
ncbi:DUF4367 domain-containing protein [Fusibacter ferrireducens]|uniref:DUF4367 domain-containing protein n=1 Tax=Fusibacter ferrireducens TaxID=2785058 RepID=A0ABR9ZNG5_9FIRM|nr:DUF4367 domain-containing protein [Fusibacter ferrireducens]MBF4692008.1 DUF4367 domain-containing protein [Fusibacter ferrireducens]